MSPSSETVAAEVRAELGRQQLSATELAARLGVTPMWLSRRLRGLTALTIDDTVRIAEALDVDPCRFLAPAPAP